jgi:cephalosporin hydroxylase
MSFLMSAFKELSRVLRAPYHRYFVRRRLRAFHARPRSLEESIDWAMNFGGGGYYRVKTMQIPAEILALAKAVRDLRPKVILEIGTDCGGTLLIWSQLAQQHVIGCDLRDMRYQARLFKDFPPPGSPCRVSLLSGNSHHPAFKERVRDTLNGQPVDFLFIDGDHTESGVS